MHLNLVRSYETPSDPTRCPLSPRGYPHWCGWPFVLVRLVRLAALHLQPVRPAARCCWFAWLRAALRGICLFSLASLAALLCYSVPLQALRNLAPCCSDSLASCAALLVRCWFLSGLFQCFAVYRVSLHLSSLAALLGICFFRSHRSRLSLCCSDCLASLCTSCNASQYSAFLL